MAAFLKEIPERRQKLNTAGAGWVGFKHIRYFTASKADVAAHQEGELAFGAVLPEKWGGVATSTSLDPRLHFCEDRQQKKGAMADLYTEWVEITALAPGSKRDSWSQYEVSQSGERTGTNSRFYGRRMAIILESDVERLAPQYDPARGASGLWPGANSPLAPFLTRFKLDPMADRGNCRRLTLYYTEPTPIQVIRPGRAVLIVNVAGRLLRSSEAERPDPDNPLGKFVLDKGGEAVSDPEGDIIIKTAATSTNVPAIWARIGKTNSNVFSHIGNAQPGTMLFLGAKIAGELIDRTYWAIDYYFKLRPLKLDDNGRLVTAFGKDEIWAHYLKYVLEVTKQTRKSGALKDVVGGPKATMVIWERDETNDETVKNAPSSVDFSDLNGQLGWY